MFDATFRNFCYVFAVLILQIAGAIAKDQCEEDLEECGFQRDKYTEYVYGKEYANLKTYQFAAHICAYFNCFKNCETTAYTEEKNFIVKKWKEMQETMEKRMLEICGRASLKTKDATIEEIGKLEKLYKQEQKEKCYRELEACGCDMTEFTKFGESVSPYYDANVAKQENVEHWLMQCAHENCQNDCKTASCYGVERVGIPRIVDWSPLRSYPSKYSKQGDEELNYELCDKTNYMTVYDDVEELGKHFHTSWNNEKPKQCQEGGCTCNVEEFEKLFETSNGKEIFDKEFASSIMRTCVHMNCIDKCNTSKVCKPTKLKSTFTRKKLMEQRNNKLVERVIQLCGTVDASTLQSAIREVEGLKERCDVQLDKCGCGRNNYTQFHKRKEEEKHLARYDRGRPRVLLQYCAFANCIEGCKTDCQFDVSLYPKAKEVRDGIYIMDRDNCQAATMESAFFEATAEMNGYLGVLVLCGFMQIK